jgi:hypothetical protein
VGGAHGVAFRYDGRVRSDIVLVGTAIAFVGDIVVHIAYGVMVDAHLAGPNTYLPDLGIAMLLWVIGVGLATLYYRLRP